MEKLLELLKTLQRDVNETRDRTRRVETRITKYLETQGFDTQVRRGQWLPALSIIEVPARDVTLREIIELLPAGHSERVPVVIKNDVVLWVQRDDA
jgi:predicted NAD/FAD-binding protein